jgi:transcriptional regulator with XRE-family HTH domain
MQIGDKIRKVRELKGLKQEAIATKLGMSVTAYGNIERNETGVNFDKLEEIAAALEVTVQDIVNLPEQLNINSITNSHVEQLGYNYGNIHKVSDTELEGYKMTITELQKQVEYLKQQNTDLLTAITNIKR